MNRDISGELLMSVCKEHQVYRVPRLSLLRNVCCMTETGSMIGMEDTVENGSCFSLPPLFNVNTTFNMC